MKSWVASICSIGLLLVAKKLRTDRACTSYNNINIFSIRDKACEVAVAIAWIILDWSTYYISIELKCYWRENKSLTRANRSLRLTPDSQSWARLASPQSPQFGSMPHACHLLTECPTVLHCFDETETGWGYRKDDLYISSTSTKRNIFPHSLSL